MFKYIYFALMLLLSCGVSADINSDKCDFHSESENELSDIVENIYDKISDADSVMVCHSKKGEKGYFYSSKVNNEYGIKYYYLIRVFPEVNDGDIFLGLLPPMDMLYIKTKSLYMCSDAATCKFQGDVGFIQVDNITPGLFFILLNNWKDIIDYDLREESSQESSFLLKTPSNLIEIRKVITSDLSKIIFSSLSYDEGGRENSPEYELMVEIDSELWSIIFDFYLGGNIVIKNVSLVN
ncbi:hypothetical protein [Corallincola spongiicola]|uniref:Uncharacterized protein n=1 Tax=Corallincola spongiicola TaxID=2520508 RepID=A0ABY1WKS7_9GAMM|nr:hypothetical protein [Corallincola spongiicola]TAA40385.1 hypothetical protein EXY25_18220 [Corallincola spongiicola]